jgi:hypothetical protein
MKSKQDKAYEEWWESAEGHARTAYNNNDHVLQVTFSLLDLKGFAVGGQLPGKVGVADPSSRLNAICNEGWELIAGSLEYVKTSDAQYKNVLAQLAPTAGRLFGTYLFKRCEPNRRVA